MKKILIIIILVLAAVLRFNQLDNLPALNADEAAIGYNAYSLLQTGRDEHGHFWPIHFESFGDWKPGLFFYIVLPFIAVFGLNEWAVRIPGALLGVATVLVIYLLVRELFPKQKNFSLFTFHFSLGEIAAFFLAISPWHIHFSRGAWEVNVGTFFITLGALLFVKGLTKPRLWIASSLSFAASLYTYHSARVVVPLLFLGVIILYKKDLWKNKGKLLLPIVTGMIILFPLFYSLTGPSGTARAQGVSIFADLGVIERINVERGEHENPKSSLAVFTHNKFINFGYEFLSNWGEHFWGQFLFLSGDEIERNKVPEVGQLYLVQLPLLIIGLLAISKNKAGFGLILWWLIVAPVASSLTFQSPHALRSHNMVIPLTIISSLGMLSLLTWARDNFKSKNLRRYFYLFLVSIFLWDFSRYLHQYYVHMPREYPFSSQYGVKELVYYVKENYDKYPGFVITNRYDQPYILFLFYLRYPPEKFQESHTLSLRDKFGFSTVNSFDKFYFTEITEQVLEKYKGYIIAGSEHEVENAKNIIHVIRFPSGDKAFKILAN